MDISALPPNQYKAAVYLLSAANNEDMVMADRQRLAAALQITPSQVTRIMRALLEAGFIERVSRGAYRIQGSNEMRQPRSINAPSRSINAPSRSVRAAEIAIPVTTSTTTAISQRLMTHLLTSNEVSKALRAQTKPKKEKQPVPIYSDSDDDLTVFGETRDDSAKRSAKKPRKQHRRAQDFGAKPRAEWTTYDLANYFAASIEKQKPRLWGTVNAHKFASALNSWFDRWDGTVAEVLPVMDRYLSDRKALDRLDRDPKPINHFLQYLKDQPRKAVIDQEWLDQMNKEAAELFGA